MIMKYQKIINLLDNTSIHLNLKQKIGLKYMTNQEERTILIAKSNLNLQCRSLVYVIIVMHIYLLKEL